MINTIQIAMYVLLICGGFFFIEILSYFMHKYLQHGVLWFLHKDHHIYKKGRFQKNDVFTIFFSTITILLLAFGFLHRFDYKFWFGLGIFLYGMGFFLYHDMVVHRRIKIKYKPKSKYLKRVVHSHRMHHQKSTATDGISFGFFIVGKKYDLE